MIVIMRDGEFTLTTELYSNKKGINMSRLPEILQEVYSKGIEMDPDSFRHLAKGGRKGGTEIFSCPSFFSMVL